MDLSLFISPFFIIVVVIIILSIIIIKLKKRRAIKILLLTPCILILFWISYSFLITINKVCLPVKKTFTFDSCSVKYEDRIKIGNCNPCWVVPCIYGFEWNSRVDILQCLCDKNKIESAKRFTSQYMELPNEQMENICNNIPKKARYL